MTPLRQKMIREMDLKNLSILTRRAYIAAVTGLSKHYQQHPESIIKEMIADYLGLRAIVQKFLSLSSMVSPTYQCSSYCSQMRHSPTVI